MPIARFQMPDGRVARFEVPEGTSPEQAQSMMEAHFAQPQQTPAQQQAQQPNASANSGQSIQSSIPGRILQGARDPIDQAAALLPKGLEAITSLGGYAPNAVSKFFGSEAARVQAINKANEEEYQASRKATGQEGSDVARFAGNVVSPVNLAIAARAPMAATLGGKIAQGAKIGAVGGALSGGEDATSPDYWEKKGKDLIAGAMLGSAIPAAVGGVARIIRPETNAKAAELLRQGVTPTPGQILGGTAQKIEEQLQSVPIIGHAITSAKGKATEEFNRAALNRALEPIGETASLVGRDGVAEVKRKISSAYDKLLPNISFRPDQQFQQEFANLQQMATGLGVNEQRKFNAIIGDVMSKASPNGSMTGETFKIAESKLSDAAKQFSGSTDAYQKELGGALNEALRIMRDSLPRTNPQYGDKLAKVNEAFANYARIRAAASSTATGKNEGIFSPSQLAMAVRQLDKSAGKGASATGKALMQDLAEQGTNVLGSHVPDSGTAGRLMTAGAGAAAVMNPKLAAAILAISPAYLGVGRDVAAKLLTQRPEHAAQVAALLRKSAPALAGAAPMAALGQ